MEFRIRVKPFAERFALGIGKQIHFGSRSKAFGRGSSSIILRAEQIECGTAGHKVSKAIVSPPPASGRRRTGILQLLRNF